MQHYWSGFSQPSYNVSEARARLKLLMDIAKDDKKTELWANLLDHVGPMYSSSGKLLWPKIALELTRIDHFRCNHRIAWAAFCFLNGVPFGTMVLLAHYSRVLKNEDAYVDILNSWSDKNKPVLSKMVNLLTWDRFQQHRDDQEARTKWT